MVHRSPARLLAPLALLAVAAAIFVVVGGGSGGGSSSPTTTTRTTKSGRVITSNVSTSTSTSTTTTPRGGRTYSIRSGDTLSVVTRRTGVSVQRLQQLNPDVDPAALRVGQKLKLVPGPTP